MNRDNTLKVPGSGIPVMLVTISEVRRSSYLSRLSDFPARYICISDLRELPKIALDNELSGVLIDTPALIKSSAQTKKVIQDILNALPSAYLNIDKGTGEPHLLIATGTQGVAHNIREFMAICQAFPARKVKPKDRYPLTLQVVISDESAEEQTVTMDLSTSGCFLFTTNPEWKPRKQLKLRFLCFKDRSLIRATICWKRGWGEENEKPPGVGVHFDRISPGQLEQLSEFLKPFRESD